MAGGAFAGSLMTIGAQRLAVKGRGSADVQSVGQWPSFWGRPAGKDGFQAQEQEGDDAGQVRMEPV